MKIYVVTIVVSVLGHWALVGGLSKAAREAPKPARVIEMAVVSPPPPPPEPVPEPPKPVEEKAKRPPPPKDLKVPEVKPAEPPPPNEQKAADEPPKPIFGISMSSTVSGNSGFSVRVGNTTMKEPEKERTDPRDVRPYAGGAPNIVPVYALAQPPKRIGECREPYPNDAKAAGIKGTVKLEVTILADGSVAEVRALNDLGYGTVDSAVRAMKKCRFTPGSDGKQAVPTQITYSYTFNYEDDD